MPDQTGDRTATFRVLDAMSAPHGGRILRLRIQGGEAPSVRSLKGARMKAVSPEGDAERTFRIDGFALFGGHPTDERLARTGRIDVHVRDEHPGDGPPVGLRWEVRGPIR